ncbi:MAG: threonylcarbamoyl-AMP synthase [Muribaculaceae bacterium]|nr:threonylcarbamoyl-AMP synthase [Muribaculaceae bacterium]
MKTETEIDFSIDLKNAVECLKAGGIILYPTDTIWGIGCDAKNSEAVKRIYDLKKRADSKAMLVLVNNESALERLVDEVPDVAWDLLEAAVNPLTIIYEGARCVAPELISDDGSLGIRITKEPFSNELCKRLGGALVSTSANVSGEKSPSNYSEISDIIKTGVDYIVKFRQTDGTEHKPSNIIKLGKGGVVKVIR